ncbi:MAG: copper resistance protein NlpE [Prevotella sp.]|uniref:copper resistance protein NlpE n=1 Tax=Prevotella sp. TaxID=59823 RepID=UPI0025DAD261|nr:copper resistance protein NlpE [Prevotella sp.]MCI7120117.1 copper resistance protein NlpE [Prevotella sp.]
MIYFAMAAAVALTTSCNGKKTVSADADYDSTSVADTTVAGENVDLAAVAGTYEGTLPAADCPGIKTVLTINADSTYELKQDYIDRKDGHDEASGVLQVLNGNVLMLVRPSSGEHTFYKVKDSKSIVMTDSLGNEAEGEMAKLYVLTKK